MQLVLGRDIKQLTNINDDVTVVDSVMDASAAEDSDALWANFDATERVLVTA